MGPARALMHARSHPVEVCGKNTRRCIKYVLPIRQSRSLADRLSPKCILGSIGDRYRNEREYYQGQRTQNYSKDLLETREMCAIKSEITDYSWPNHWDIDKQTMREPLKTRNYTERMTRKARESDIGVGI